MHTPTTTTCSQALFVSLFLCAHTHKAQIATNRNLQASLVLCMMRERFLERVLHHEMTQKD
jgi:hypothetical protein